MKKVLLISSFIWLSLISYSQKIDINNIDKFTGQHEISTSQEALVKRNKWKNQWQQLLISLRNVDGEWLMPAFIELNEIEKYDENSQLLLRLDNGEVIILPTLYTGIGTEECPIGLGGINSHVHGFSTVFPLTEENIKQLKYNEVTDVRISPLGQNYDFEISKKERSLIQKMINLIDKEIKNKASN